MNWDLGHSKSNSLNRWEEPRKEDWEEITKGKEQ